MLSKTTHTHITNENKTNLFQIVRTVENTVDGYIALCTYRSRLCIVKSVSIDQTIGVKAKVLLEISGINNNKHKNIIELYDVLHDKDYVYLILEYGLETLSDINIKNLDANRLISEISEAVKFVHKNGYIHGDISFRNVMKFDSCFKLIDFGNSIRSYRHSVCSIPTLNVAPIEILCDNQNWTCTSNPEKIDSWSLGCLFYYVKTGDTFIPDFDDPDFNDLDNEQIVEKMITTQSEKLNQQNVNECIKKLLDYKPESRINVSQFLEEFEQTENQIENKKQNNIVNSISKKYRKINIDTKILLLKILLHIDINFNISVENIFITFGILRKYLNKIKIPFELNANKEQIFLIFGIVIFTLTTKLVSKIEFEYDYTISIIKYHCNLQITTNELSEIIFNILDTSSMKWNIDIENPLNFTNSIPKDILNKFTTLLLCVLLVPEFEMLNALSQKDTIVKFLSGSDHIVKSDPMFLIILQTLKKMIQTQDDHFNLIRDYYFNMTNEDFSFWILNIIKNDLE